MEKWLLGPPKPRTIKRMDLNIKLENQGDMPPSPISRQYFPSFTVIQRDSEDQADLDEAPIEGEMTIRYCISRSTEDNKTGECTYTVEVKEIISAEEDEDTSPSKSYGKEAGDALDKLAEEKSKSNY
jgi:hypothetical protein